MGRAFDRHEPDRILFGVGREAETAGVLRALGAERVLLVCQGRHRDGADRLADQLGSTAVGVFDQVRQHVPEALVEVARRQAREVGADWVVSHGGGSAVGFAKAVALEGSAKVGAVVTTYAGSERTSIWGITGPAGKRTGRDERVRPKLVVYDPELTLGLDRQFSLQSLFNALAHVTGELWAPASDERAGQAVEAAGQIRAGLRALAADPTDLDARTEALYACFLASSSIERATLSLQHRLAHALGGTFDVQHAAGHTAVLPYTLGFNGMAVPDAMERLEPIFGEDPPAALYDLARELDLPHSLKDLGLGLEDLPRLVEPVLEHPYPNPRPVDRAALTELVDDAYHARRPSLFSRRRDLGGSGPHARLRTTERGARLSEARAVLIAVHGRGAAADRITRDLEAHLPDRAGLCLLAPQALDNRWYPQGFTAPLQDNQPDLDSALSMLDAAWSAAIAVVPPERVVVAGFSQGGCLALSWARTRSVAPGGLLALSAAELDVVGDYTNLANTRVVLSKSEGDPYVPAERFEGTAARLRASVEALEVRVEPGAGHAITEADSEALARIVAAALS